MPNLPLEVVLSGDDADAHEMPAYDGFNSLAGLSLATSIVAHYAATGKLRRKGQFETRAKIRFKEYRQGSLVFGLIIEYASTHPWVWAVGGGVMVNMGSSALYDLLKRTFKKNIGQFHDPETEALEILTDKREGDLEALAAATEAGLRQAHSVIGNGARVIETRVKPRQEISTFDKSTKEYITKSIVQEEIFEKDVSVAAFNANSGYGRVFDEDLGRTVGIFIPDALLPGLKATIGFGLSEYSRGSGRKISIKFTRVVALDDRPKKYIILDAEIPRV